MDRRAQGRPCRGANQVGRSGIVESVRHLLRTTKCSDISRKNLALHIGVTPALITYYFPKKESLMDEVVTPVIEDYRIRLAGTAKSDLPPEQRLRKIIMILTDLYGNDSRILEIYRSLEEIAPQSYQEFSMMTSILSEFFFGWGGDARVSSFDAAVLHGAVRGMCEFARRAREDVTALEPRAEEDSKAETEWLEPLHRLLLAGRGLFAAKPGPGTLAVAL